VTAGRTQERPAPAGLRRFRAPAPPRAERCELCDAPLPAQHRHLVDTERRSLACACAGCAALFPPTAERGRFRAVPRRLLTDSGLQVAPGAWEGLGIPVSMAFFCHDSALDRIVVRYPSPAGATESEVDPARWRAVFGATALAGMLRADVEALLVRRPPGGDCRTACYLVPLDAAYELAGRLRRHWRGFDGGAEAHAVLEEFFERLRRDATDVAAAAGDTDRADTEGAR
jgi:hypothetical protein